VLEKKYRLSEREVKKVLHKGKPFFSYSIVFNVFPNKLSYNRYAIVIGSKSVPNNVIRNMYRRAFYDISWNFQAPYIGDIVCVVKSKTKLLKTQEDMKKFSREIYYIYHNKLWKNI
jgi:ribonuclease P protein component